MVRLASIAPVIGYHIPGTGATMCCIYSEALFAKHVRIALLGAWCPTTSEHTLGHYCSFALVVIHSLECFRIMPILLAQGHTPSPASLVALEHSSAPADNCHMLAAAMMIKDNLQIC